MDNINRNRFSWSRVVVLTLTGVVVMLLWVQRGESQMFSPYSDFQAMTLDQLATLQVKLTYLGSQRSVIRTLAFTSSVNTLDLNQFVPFRRPGINYQNDDAGAQTFSASAAELQSLINNVATLPNVTVGGVAAIPYLSFSLVNTQPAVKGFEAVVDTTDAASLFDQLRLSLANNKEGSRKLSEMACPLDLLPAGVATDVRANVSVVLSGVRLDRTTGRFVGTATVTNTSAGTLGGPVSVGFLLASNVGLANADGATCRIKPAGISFIDLPLIGNQLPPGGSAQVNLEFNNPDKHPITATTKVLAGPGAR